VSSIVPEVGEEPSLPRIHPELPQRGPQYAPVFTGLSSEGRNVARDSFVFSQLRKRGGNGEGAARPPLNTLTFKPTIGTSGRDTF